MRAPVIPTAERNLAEGAVPPLPLGSRLRLAAEILLTYGNVRWCVWRFDLPRAVAMLTPQIRVKDKTRPLPDGVRDGLRLGAAVGRTLHLMPADSRCLMRSLVLLRLLARRGVKGSLVIAVMPGDELELKAHAWVELDGRPLLEPATAGYGRLVML